MKQYRDINHSALIDLLAKHTTLYTQMLSDNIKTNEFYKCKRTIEQLTAEIELRKRNASSENSTISTPVSFGED
jgi:hypothetical protein